MTAFARLRHATVAYASSTGTPQWVARYAALGGGADAPHALVVSHNGSHVFVTGDSATSGSGTDYATVGYATSDGGESFIQRYNGTGNGDDIPSSIGIKPDGSKLFVTGQSAGSGTGPTTPQWPTTSSPRLRRGQRRTTGLATGTMWLRRSESARTASGSSSPDRVWARRATRTTRRSLTPPDQRTLGVRRDARGCRPGYPCRAAPVD